MVRILKSRILKSFEILTKIIQFQSSLHFERIIQSITLHYSNLANLFWQKIFNFTMKYIFFPWISSLNISPIEHIYFDQWVLVYFRPEPFSWTDAEDHPRTVDSLTRPKNDERIYFDSFRLIKWHVNEIHLLWIEFPIKTHGPLKLIFQILECKKLNVLESDCDLDEI